MVEASIHSLNGRSMVVNSLGGSKNVENEPFDIILNVLATQSVLPLNTLSKTPVRRNTGTEYNTALYSYTVDNKIITRDVMQSKCSPWPLCLSFHKTL